MIKEFHFMVAGISSSPFRTNAAKLKDRSAKQTVFLVPEPDNKYDTHAILVMASAPVGRLPIGYVPARRFCANCDPYREKRGHKAYDDNKGLALRQCPECERELSPPLTEQILKVLLQAGTTQQCQATFVGDVPGKENIGAAIHCRLQTAPSYNLDPKYHHTDDENK